ncbi:DUF2730 family protein [Zavarzinia aquatilis]|uniref:DUF2730 domain-containing protein n=1 Tax=Zavarzinia aquatilis TaxID=2211142 RepID=A0A317DSJ7_9PROT|nr:DUF2730 family protein [Zavarzinia aquatilis]PWR17647.1 hypothetical protein DKG74_20785 [Zavarzinia aquatilis]
MEILDWAAKYAGVIQLVLAAGLGAALLWLRASFVPRTEFRAAVEEIEDQLKAQSARLEEGEKLFTMIRQRLDAMPKAQDFHNIQLGLAEVRGDLGRLSERVGGVKEIVERVEDQVTRHEVIFSDAARRT